MLAQHRTARQFSPSHRWLELDSHRSSSPQASGLVLQQPLPLGYSAPKPPRVVSSTPTCMWGLFSSAFPSELGTAVTCTLFVSFPRLYRSLCFFVCEGAWLRTCLLPNSVGCDGVKEARLFSLRLTLSLRCLFLNGCCE